MKKLLLFACMIALFTACGGGEDGGSGNNNSDVVTYDTYPGSDVWASYGFSVAPSQPGTYLTGIEVDGMMMLVWENVDSSAYDDFKSEMETKLPYVWGPYNTPFYGPYTYPVEELGLTDSQAEGVIYTYDNQDEYYPGESHQGNYYMAIVLHVLSPFDYQGLHLKTNDTALVLAES